MTRRRHRSGRRRSPARALPVHPLPTRLLLGCLLGLGLLLSAHAVRAQQLDLTQGGPIDITARDGIEWRQAEKQVIARGDARAVRGAVTVTADRLTAWYRKKATADGADQKAPQPGAAASGAAQPASAQPASAQPASLGLGPDTESGGNEIYRLQADGNVHIFTQTDHAQGDKAVYDLDQAVLVMTGRDLRLTTPNDVLTARDDLEYWPQKHMAVARGDAVVVTSDAKRVAADTLVAYTRDNPPPDHAARSPAGTPSGGPSSGSPSSGAPAGTKTDAVTDPLGSSGKVERVEAFGHVSIRTPTDIVTGDRAVYVPDTGMARLAGNVRITRGQNQLNGAEADVNMKTGVARLLAPPKGRVAGLVLPNDESNKTLDRDSVANPPAEPPARPSSGSRR
ncbi:LptA/OstA family protein [Rhodopila sp.]|uniref:LptA/OstA family protein n=1 Tax=Rhodopila sp. TaxID=2480087 RepID=UPI002CE9B5AA|nr:LptA/OstA family protein [Rhodopila sp.]HVZ09870.1 LptA/OstA family protein [Rhodopila sp.]